MLPRKFLRFINTSPCRRVQWAVRLEGKTPAFWRDIKFISTESAQKRNRLDILGPKGIGKTFLTTKLANQLGEVGPRQKRIQSPVSDGWSDAFNSIISSLGEKMVSPALGYEYKVRKMAYLDDVLELESLIIRNLASPFVIVGESIVRHKPQWFTDTALIQPDFISQLLEDRLLLICDADDPVERAIKGRQKRGDSMSDSPQLRKSVEKEIQAIRQSASILAALGIPVLTINLDRPIQDNIAIVGRFLEENYVTSRRIRKWAERAR